MGKYLDIARQTMTGCDISDQSDKRGMSHAEVMESVQEAIEERAAITEYDGGLPRGEAETQAKARMRVYEYKLTDGPRWLVMLAPGCDLLEAQRSLRQKFGERFVSVREWRTV